MEFATFARDVLDVELSPAQETLVRKLKRRAVMAGRRCGKVLLIGNPMSIGGSYFDAFRAPTVGETRYLGTFSNAEPSPAPAAPPFMREPAPLENETPFCERTVLSSHRYGKTLAASNAALAYSIQHVQS